MIPYASDAVFVENENFSRFDVPYKRGPYGVKGAAFRRHDVFSVLGHTVAKRAEAVFVAQSDKL